MHTLSAGYDQLRHQTDRRKHVGLYVITGGCLLGSLPAGDPEPWPGPSPDLAREVEAGLRLGPRCPAARRSAIKGAASGRT